MDFAGHSARLAKAKTERYPTELDDLERVVQLLDHADELRRNQVKLATLTSSLREGVMGMLPVPTSLASMAIPVSSAMDESVEIDHAQDEEASAKSAVKRRMRS